MTDVVVVCTKQRVVTEFLTVEGFSPTEIHRSLRSVYGEDAIDASSDAGSNRCKSGKKDIVDTPNRGRPVTAVMTESKGKFDALVRDDSSITTRELCTARGIDKPVIMDIIRELGYRKFCATCLPKMLTVEHKTDRQNSGVARGVGRATPSEIPKF